MRGLNLELSQRREEARALYPRRRDRDQALVGNRRSLARHGQATRDSVVRWTSSESRFSLTDRSAKLKVSGRAKSGQTFVVRRTYRGVRVRAAGRWTLTIAPLPAPKR